MTPPGDPRPWLTLDNEHTSFSLSWAPPVGGCHQSTPQADPVCLDGGFAWGARCAHRRRGAAPEGPLAPSSSPLLLQHPLWALLSPGPGRTHALPAQPLTAPQPGALGFSLPTDPELWVVHGRPRAPSLVPDACRGGRCWGEPHPCLAVLLLPLASWETAGSPAPFRFCLPRCVLRLVQGAGLWQRTGPWTDSRSVPHGQPGPVGPCCPTLKA